MRILAIALAFASGLSMAEPGPTAQYLMNERASLLDLGIYRFNLYLSLQHENDNFWQIMSYPLEEDPDLENLSKLSRPDVSYDFGSDEIRVEYSGVFDDAETARSTCEYSVNVWRGVLKITENLGTSIWLNYFDHAGFVSSNRPEDVQYGITDLVVVYCQLTVGIFSPSEERILGRGGLTETSVFFANVDNFLVPY